MTSRLTLCLLVAVLAGCARFSNSSPLIGAARNGDDAAIRRLIRQGADPNETGGVNNWSALEHAIHKNQPKSVEALLKAGALPNRVTNNMTPLMMAASNGYADIVILLLRHGADPRARTARFGTALDITKPGATAVAEAILQAAPDLRPAQAAR